jgi:hypothetical protein
MSQFPCRGFILEVQSCRVTAYIGENRVNAQVLLDTGSTHILISKELFNNLRKGGVILRDVPPVTFSAAGDSTFTSSIECTFPFYLPPCGAMSNALTLSLTALVADTGEELLVGYQDIENSGLMAALSIESAACMAVRN